MSGQLKEVRTRISSVKSTQQITKAMKLVSAAKLRRAQDAIIQIRPYSGKLNDILSNIAKGNVELELATEREVSNVLIIAISSDRGLCGGYNANVAKQVRVLLNGEFSEQHKAGNVTLMPIGKKVFDAFKATDIKLEMEFNDLFLRLNYAEATKVTEHAVEGFISGKYDEVRVVYSKFKNAAVQLFTIEKYLPIQKLVSDQDTKVTADYILEPSQEEMLVKLVPKILRTQFYRYMLDARASEHGARMTSMDKATENANDLLKELKLKYNRARQAAITTELTEIVSGAAALEGA